MKVLKPEENQELKLIEGLFPKEIISSELNNKIFEIKKCENENKQKNLKHETNECVSDVEQYETTRSFSESIYSGKITIDEAEEDKTDHLESMIGFNNKTRQKIEEEET